MEVRPTRAFSSACCTTRSLSLSSALVASSSRSTGGSRTSARQMATRCFCPPDRRLPRGPTCVSQPLWLSMLSRNSKCDRVLQSSNHASVTVSPSSRPYMTFSFTVVLNKIGSWPTKPTCLRHHLMFTELKGVLASPMYTPPSAGS
mmetsp:Transcript_12331/g.36634  ORF Transcript_12331/g.36634 Transcript_12331/m.36634 type:complete len:146 (+) Transcript_12331:237-674(+)